MKKRNRSLAGARVRATEPAVVATDTTNEKPVVEAAGNSEGAKKGWDTKRAQGAIRHQSEQAEKHAALEKHHTQAAELHRKACKHCEEGSAEHKHHKEAAEDNESKAKHHGSMSALHKKSAEYYKNQAEGKEERTPVVEATGNSEGAKKGWEVREHGGKAYHYHLRHGSGNFYSVHRVGDFDDRWTAGFIGNDMHPYNIGGIHKSADVAQKACEEHAASVKATSTGEQEPVVQARNVIHCKSQGSPLRAKKTWEVDKPIDFMWMPGGVHTIHASYGRTEDDMRPIELTVNCNEAGASNVQSAFEAIRANSPRRPPFICVEHKAQERAGEPVEFMWKVDPEPAIYCRCLPSALGATNVNGKIHTSFSPTFDTDAEYHKMLCTDCKKSPSGPSVCACETGAGWYFPDGARGSRSNPAQVTAPDVQSVGSLTNWNAFREMLPVAAREQTPVVEAAGTSEGVKKSWESRREGARSASQDASIHSGLARNRKTLKAYRAAAAAHEMAAEHHEDLAKDAPDQESKDFHAGRAAVHRQNAKTWMNEHDEATTHSSNTEEQEPVVQATDTQETNLAVHAAQAQTDQQPVQPNAGQATRNTMKVKFVRAQGTFKPGDEADLDVTHAAVQAGDALVPAAADAVLAREAEFTAAQAREKEAHKSKILQACDRGVTRGSIKATGDTEQSLEKVRAKYIGRFDRGECSADICVEQIEGMAVIEAEEEPARRTSSNGASRTEVGYGSGEVSGHALARAILIACEPFQKTLRSGGIVSAAGRGEAARPKIVQAIDAAREKTRLLAKLDKEMQGGFVVRAATLNYVDPASNNPLGLLNVELMLLNNLGHLENQLAPIRDITTNIAGMPVAFNQQVRTRYFAIPKVQLKTATTAWSNNQTGSNTDVNVKLDQYAGVPIAFENTMIASTPRPLFREQYDPQLYGLGEYILYKLITTIFAGNTRIANNDETTATIKFQDNANNVFDISGATLKTFVSDLPAKLDLLKMPGGDEPPGVQDLMRYAWVHTQPYAQATGDTNFILNQSIQSIRPGGSSNGNLMETGLFERLGNLKFRKSQLMADNISITGSGADATTNGITVNAPTFLTATNVGFAGTRSALLFVSRVPEDYTQILPNLPTTAAVETVMSPQLGLTFLVVKFLDHSYEIANMRVQLMFGFAIGDERQGCLLYKT
jgi:hypothetical protein